jgi:hypothetical protein
MSCDERSLSPTTVSSQQVMWRVIIILNHGFMPTGLCVIIGGTQDSELYMLYDSWWPSRSWLYAYRFLCDWIIIRHVPCEWLEREIGCALRGNNSHILTDEVGLSVFKTDGAKWLFLELYENICLIKHDADSLWSRRWLTERHDNMFSGYKFIVTSHVYNFFYSEFGLSATVVFSQFGFSTLNKCVMCALLISFLL